MWRAGVGGLRCGEGGTWLLRIAWGYVGMVRLTVVGIGGVVARYESVHRGEEERYWARGAQRLRGACRCMAGGRSSIDPTQRVLPFLETPQSAPEYLSRCVVAPFSSRRPTRTLTSDRPDAE